MKLSDIRLTSFSPTQHSTGPVQCKTSNPVHMMCSIPSSTSVFLDFQHIQPVHDHHRFDEISFQVDVPKVDDAHQSAVITTTRSSLRLGTCSY